MAGLYAFIGGAAGKFSEIQQEQRNLAGEKELETLKLQKTKHLNEELDDEFFGDFQIKYGADLANAPNDPSKRRVLFNNAVRAFDNPTNQKALQTMSTHELDDLQSYLVAKGNDFFHYRPDGEGNNVIQDYNYDNLKDVLGNRFFDSLQGIDPTWELDTHIDDKTGETLKINKDMAQESPDKFDYEEIPNFEEVYGTNFGEDVLRNGQYGNMTDIQASHQKPWMKVAATLGYQRSQGYIGEQTYMRELAEIQASYGLSDSQIIEGLFVGHKKYKLHRSGDSYTKISMGQSEETVKQMAGVAQNALAETELLITEVQKLRQMYEDSGTAGAAAAISQVLAEAFYGPDAQLKRLAGLMNEVTSGINRENGIVDFGEQPSDSEAHQQMQDAYDYLNSQYRLMQEHGHKQDYINNVIEAQKDVLTISIAYRLAKIEQGSGGKAVSDNDFEQALKRVKGGWLSDATSVIGRLDIITDSIRKSQIAAEIFSGETSAHGGAIMAKYNHFIKAKDALWNEYETIFKPNKVMSKRVSVIRKFMDDNFGAAPDVKLDDRGRLVSAVNDRDIGTLFQGMSDRQKLMVIPNNELEQKISDIQQLEDYGVEDEWENTPIAAQIEWLKGETVMYGGDKKMSYWNVAKAVHDLLGTEVQEQFEIQEPGQLPQIPETAYYGLDKAVAHLANSLFKGYKGEMPIAKLLKEAYLKRYMPNVPQSLLDKIGAKNESIDNRVPNIQGE
jgi:hypothetical protein